MKSRIQMFPGGQSSTLQKQFTLENLLLTEIFKKESQRTPVFNLKPKFISTTDNETGWMRLVKDIVRPPRFSYKDIDLGTKTFSLNEIRYRRNELQVRHQNKKIVITLYEPDNKNNWLILYLHGNSSSRLEAAALLKHLPIKFSLASFDFIGCGLNEEADTISLGYRESQQVESVAKELQERGFKIILWGRSMGAGTALTYGKAPIIVADSAFESFRSLCKQIAVRHSPSYLPNCLISCLFPCIFLKLRGDVKTHAQYDIQKLDIKKAVSEINRSTFLLFMSGDEDMLVDMQNSQKLYNSFEGNFKYLQIFKGSHNSKRPDTSIKKIMKKIADHVLVNLEIQPQPISKGKISIQLQSES